MTTSTTQLIFSATNISGKKKILLLAMAEMEDENGKAYINILEISQLVSLDEKTVYEIIHLLQADGLIYETGAEDEFGNFQYQINILALRSLSDSLEAERVRRYRAMPLDAYCRTNHWQRVRSKAIEAQGKRCRDCGAEDKQLHVHHIGYENLGREDPIKDLNVLCEDCHSDADKKRRSRKR